MWTHCTNCGAKLDSDALMHEREVCTPCGVAGKGGYTPELGPPDPAALAYINRVWEQIPESAEFKRIGQAPVKLKALILAEREAIRKQERFRNTVVAAVERATGIRRGKVGVR